MCFGCIRRITFNVTCNLSTLIVLCSRTVNTPVILLFSEKWAPGLGLSAEDNTHTHTNPLLCSSRTSVRVKLGLFNAKICNENRCFIHRLTYQLNEQDFLCHSAQNVSLILVTSLLDGGLKWVYFVIITVKNQGQWLCFGCVRRITLTVTRSNVTCYVLCSRKVSALWTLQLFCYSPKSGSQVLVQRTIGRLKWSSVCGLQTEKRIWCHMMLNVLAETRCHWKVK